MGDKKPKTDHLKPTQFKKGQSGNPGGKPRKPAITAMLREFVFSKDPGTKKLWGERIVEAIAKKAAKGNVAAFAEITNRLDGKPKETVELVEKSKMPGVSDAELARKLQVRGAQGPDGGPADGA